MDRSDLENGINELGELDAESRKVSALLRTLPRVEAPANFEFGVKARIAGGAAPTAGLLRFAKLAAPLMLMLVVGAFVIYYGSLPAVAPPVAEAPLAVDETRTLAAVPAETDRSTVSAPPVVKQEPSPFEMVSTNTRGLIPVRQTTRREPGDRLRTRQESLRPANVLMPPGFEDANPQRSTANSNTGPADSTVSEVLGIIGVTAEFTDAGWTVLSVAANSVAERSGIKPSDVIEAIGGQELKRDTTLKGEVKRVRVRREGKQIEVGLKN